MGPLFGCLKFGNYFSQTINRSKYATHCGAVLTTHQRYRMHDSTTRMTRDKDRNCIFWLEGNSRLPVIWLIWDRINFQRILWLTIFLSPAFRRIISYSAVKLYTYYIFLKSLFCNSSFVYSFSIISTMARWLLFKPYVHTFLKYFRIS